MDTLQMFAPSLCLLEGVGEKKMEMCQREIYEILVGFSWQFQYFHGKFTDHLVI